MKVVGKHYRIHGDMSVWHQNIIISRETYYVRPWENILLSSHLGKSYCNTWKRFLYGNAYVFYMGRDKGNTKIYKCYVMQKLKVMIRCTVFLMKAILLKGTKSAINHIEILRDKRECVKIYLKAKTKLNKCR